MRVRWTTPAAKDLEGIFDYLQEHYPRQAHSTIIEIRGSIRSLVHFPYRGRKGNAENTRELPHPRLPYIVVYRVKDHLLEVLHIWHGAQDR